ncbi:MAG: acetolactate synthase large subunit [Desulfovibrio sp.]|jgi:acetolactate synthase-1/2/3 large subunit|nr:acetolactate synthase large subunit [Desulfovibrio sp.]
MNASNLFVQALENEGVEYVFGIPGEENLHLLEALRKSRHIKLILTRHEQGAGFMAATYGRLTGKPGVCLSTLGPGATNLVTAAAYAQLGAMPMVMITGQKPIKKSRQGKFQIVDVVAMMRPLTKYTRQINHREHVPAIVREAFRLAGEERPGAAHIEFPEDIAADPVYERELFAVQPQRIPVAEPRILERAAQMLRQAKKPLLLIGAGANRKRASAALTRLVDNTGICFFNTQMGKGIVDERHPLYLGTAALSDHDHLHDAIVSADLIINVGHDTIEKPPFFMRHDDNRTVIHVNFFAAEVDEVYFPQLNIIGDIASTIHRLTDLLTQGPLPQWDRDFFLSIRDTVKNIYGDYARDDRFPLLPQRLVQITRELVPDDGIVTLDNGIYKLWFSRDYPVYAHNCLLLDNALATMGAGLPSAIAAKLLHPRRKVVSINGDGGFMMNSQELETAIRLGLDLVVVILNDGAYGMIKWKQQGLGYPPFGLDYGNPDFVRYAESFGAAAHRPDSADSFREIFASALEGKGVHVIDLPVDYSLNHEILSVRPSVRDYVPSQAEAPRE